MLCSVTIQLEKRICEDELMNKYYLCCVVLLSCIWNVHNLLNNRVILYFNNELFNNEGNIMNINVSVIILQGDDDDEVKNDNVIYNSIKEKNQYKEEYY